MQAVVRKAAAAAVLVLALTGCQDEGKSPAAGSVLAPPAPGKNQPAPAPSKLIRLDPTGLMDALPDESHVNEQFVGGEPDMAQVTEAAQYCVKEAETTCIRFLALALKEIEVRGSSQGTRVEFKLYSFDTAEQANATLKSLADKQRKTSDGHGEPSKPVTLASSADETDAFQDNATAEAFMRIGTVVAHISTTETEPGTLGALAGSGYGSSRGSVRSR